MSLRRLLRPEGSRCSIYFVAAGLLRRETSRVMNNGPSCLPRLPREYYQADAVVHWTLTAYDRAKVCANPGVHRAFREVMLHTCGRYSLICPIYCLMPDHLHFVWMGSSRQSDQLTAIRFLNTYFEPCLAPARFQPQAHDEVLREKQRKRNAFCKICFYIAANPVRAELVENPADWPYTGSVILGYPKMNPLAEDHWDKFWRIYFMMRSADAGDILRPPLSSPQLP